MNIFLIRHAEAEKNFFLKDSERKLTEEGRKRFISKCKENLNSLNKIEVIYSSPYTRAQQTAIILKDHITEKDLEIDYKMSLRPGLEFSEVNYLIENSNFRSIAIVGHQPDMTYILKALIGGNEISFDTGTIAEVKIKSTGNELIQLIK